MTTTTTRTWIVSLPIGPQGCLGYREEVAPSLRAARRVAEQYLGIGDGCRLMRCADGSYAVMRPGTRAANPGWLTWCSIRRARAQTACELDLATHSAHRRPRTGL